VPKKKLTPPTEPIEVVPGSERKVENAPPPGSHPFEFDDSVDSGDEEEEAKIVTSGERRTSIISHEEEVPPGEGTPSGDTVPPGEEAFDPANAQKRISDLMDGYRIEHEQRLKADEENTKMRNMLNEVASRVQNIETQSQRPPAVNPEQDWNTFSQQGPRAYLDQYLHQNVAPILYAMGAKMQEIEGRAELSPQEEKYKESLEEVYTEYPHLRENKNPEVRKLAIGIAREKEKIKGLMEATKDELAKIQRGADRNLLASKAGVANPSTARIEETDEWNFDSMSVEDMEKWFGKKKLIRET